MGREFNDLFDQWAQTYDGTISGHDLEYTEVFTRYDEILEEVADRASGFVIEFGVGTGNLTSKLVSKGSEVYAVEPSQGMREKAKEKLPDLTLIDGDFLQFPYPSEKADAIVSTYAFHHLTDEEKDRAIGRFHQVLKENGRIIFADTVFLDDNAYKARIKESEEKGFFRLAEDLKSEYYTTIPVLTKLFEKNGFLVKFEQQNEFVWLIDSIKKEK